MRGIDGKLWSNKFFFSLSPEEKLLYLYFITTGYTNDLGIYEASHEYIVLETKIENYKELLKGKLSTKIIYIEDLDIIWVKDIHQYNLGRSRDYRKSLYYKLCELDDALREYILKESKYLKSIYDEFSNNNSVNNQNETIGGPCIHGGGTVSEKEKEKEAPLKKEKENTPSKEKERSPLILSPKEKENTPLKEKEKNQPQEREKESTSVLENTSTIVEELNAQTQQENNPSKVKKKRRTQKYPDDVVNFVSEFKKYRENYLKVPITQKDWHLKAYAVTQKLLKKYPPSELHEALRDLQTSYWEDKASKILELWHFEDWLPRWKVWKYPPTSVIVKTSQDDKYRRLYYEVFGKYPEN